ncbi:MAG: hypothetical protein SNH35_04410 [Rikenellaceae bacterium]
MGIFSTIRGIPQRIRQSDPHGTKRMQLFLGTMVFITIFNLLTFDNLPKNIEAQSTGRCDLIFSKYSDTVKLRRGIKVNIIGYNEATSDSAPTYWVDTEDGERGEVPQVYFDNDFLSLADIDSLNLKIADKVKIAPNPRGGDTYILTLESGQRLEITMKDMKKFTSERVNKKLASYERGEMWTLMSKHRFERKFIGRKLKRDYADYIRNYGEDSTVVRYGIKVISKAEERRGVFYPVVCFGKDGIAQSYRLEQECKMNGNGRYLSYIPLSGVIIDHLGFIIRSKYGFITKLKPVTLAKDSTIVTTFTIIVAFFVIVLGTLWALYSNHIFLAVVFSLLPYRKPLYMFSNRGLYLLLTLLYWVSTYVWIVLLLAYGAIWWIIIPLIIYTSMRLNDNYYSKLIQKPVFRCDKCKDLGTKYQASRKYVRTYISTEVSNVLDDITRGSRSVKTTYTDASGRSREGSKSISTETRHYKKMKYTYNVDVYHATYVCSTCDNSECLEEEDRTLISKEHLSSHSETRDR